jgi:hypothetical protein
MLQIRSASYLTFVWPCGAQQPFIVHTGYNIQHLSVAIFIPHLRVKWLKARSEDDRPYLYFYLLWRLSKIDGAFLAHCFTDTTFLLFKVKTAFIDIGD